MSDLPPTFSFITAVYKSAPYLPEYLSSLTALDGGLGDVEVLFIDDGSPDESASIIEEWISATDAPAKLIQKEHGGSISARNVGLDHALGKWVSFPDPDDVLDRRYLASVREFLASPGHTEGDVGAMATKVVQFQESATDALDDHPLGYRYRQGPRRVRLAEEPRFFHSHAPSGFYRRSVIERAGLRLDPHLSAAFEDAAFVAEYLLQFDDPVVGFVPGAVYRYRRRSDSVTGTMWSKPDRYTAVPQDGYLRLLRLRPEPPTWLQLLVLYDLVWYFHEYEQAGSPNRVIDDSVADRFLGLLDEVLELLDEAVVYGYPLHPLPMRIRAALATRKTGRLSCREGLVVPEASDSLSVSYFLPPAPADRLPEVITVDGVVQREVEVDERPIEYYGEVFLIERTVRLRKSGTVMVLVEGEFLSLAIDLGGHGALWRWVRDPTPVGETSTSPTSPKELRRRGSLFRRNRDG